MLQRIHPDFIASSSSCLITPLLPADKVFVQTIRTTKTACTLYILYMLLLSTEWCTACSTVSTTWKNTLYTCTMTKMMFSANDCARYIIYMYWFHFMYTCRQHTLSVPHRCIWELSTYSRQAFAIAGLSACNRLEQSSRIVSVIRTSLKLFPGGMSKSPANKGDLEIMS